VRQRSPVAGLEAEHVHGLDAHGGARPGDLVGRVDHLEGGVRVLGPDFQRNTVPGWTGPSTVTDLTSGFQNGLWLMAEITENTVWGSASIRSSPSAVAGAFRLISMGGTSSEVSTRRDCSIRIAPPVIGNSTRSGGLV
jgi:hypothetical protein